MTVKEFLRSVRSQDNLLRAYEQELEDLRRRAYSISSPRLGDKIQANHLVTLDEIVAKIEQQAAKVNAAWDELIDRRNKARFLISKVEDENSRCVLYRYYILTHSWEQIAVDTGYALRHVYRLHGEGLQILEKTSLNVIKCH